MSAQVNPHDPRVKRTRQLLLRAFTDLVREQSFEAITVQDIAERATLNRATFYAHFPDKYALLDASIGDSFTELLLQRIPEHAEIGEETIRSLILAVCDYHGELSAQCKRSYQTLESLLEPRILGHLQGFLRGCFARSEATRACGPEALALASTVVSWAIYGAVLGWNKAGRPQAAEAVAESMLPLIMGCISAVGG